ncbi:MAG TPA: SipW-dependent-type signal peptide-containing protein [Dehalococcoidia bacterium]|jgi:predicted ribosomally synthesized peptide with SipW-like signal peptide|nr:SipW-dependent-type signal peptide-containing protein [Dehalococcoidia bacterium]
MKRSILLSVLIIGAVAALVGAGSWATFSDTETSANNIVSTGSLNLKVGTTTGGAANCNYADPWTGPLFSLTNAAPGDSDEVTICLKNDGSLKGDLSTTFSNFENVEVGACAEPESSAGDTTCNNGDPGELAQFVNVVIWADDNCDNVQDSGEHVFFNGTAAGLPSATIPSFPYTPGTVNCVGTKATVGSNADNTAQTDKVEIDVNFTLTQAP